MNGYMCSCRVRAKIKSQMFRQTPDRRLGRVVRWVPPAGRVGDALFGSCHNDRFGGLGL